MNGRLIVLLAALALGVGGGLCLFARTPGAPPAPERPETATAAPLAALAPACVRDVLPASKARIAWITGAYEIGGGPGAPLRGTLSEAERSRAVPRVPVGDLAEGAYTLRVGDAAQPFVVDRTAPQILLTDPPADSCPGEALRVVIAPGEACPVACSLRRGGRIVATAPALPGPDGLACTLPTSEIAAGEGTDGTGWQLILRDAAGNARRAALAWPTPTLTASGPARVPPGETISARLVGRPGGGSFEARLLASEALGERVTTEARADSVVATVTFRAPDAPQVVGIDAAYRLAPGCPPAAPVPFEIEVVSSEPEAARALGGLTILGGGSQRPATCGNGVVDPGEACDGGGVTARCDADCTRPRCGDGILNPLAGEHCEPGALTPSCSPRCTLSCGNGQLDQGEACDGGGETARCNLDCTAAVCGDGITNFAAGEQCDEGEENGSASCDARCQVPAGFEEEDPAIQERRRL